MHPERAARSLATLGSLFLIAVLALRLASLAIIIEQTPNRMADAPFRPIVPAFGHYVLSSDGKQATFEQQTSTGDKNGWFSVPLEGGPVSAAPVTPADPPPFKVNDRQVSRLAGDTYEPLKGLPPRTRVSVYAIAPNGGALAFAAYRPGQAWSLYILSAAGQLDWLGDQASITEIAWSPDGKNLAFIAPAGGPGGTDQIFLIDRNGQEQRQLTSGAARKSSPRWSPDGHTIAFIANSPPGPVTLGAVTPTPESLFGPTPSPDETAGLSSINLVDTESGAARKLVEDERTRYDLAWGIVGGSPHLVYAVRLPDHPKTAYLYTLDPQTGKSRQAYPFLAMTPLKCPMQIPSGESGIVTITISNSSLRPANVPLVLRASPLRFSDSDKTNAYIVRSETVQVPPGTSKTVEWQVPAASGLVTHIAGVISPGDASPVLEQRCSAANTYHGLPNLPFLAFVVPLSAAGMLLYIPWLLQQKRRWFWALYLIFPLMVLLIISFEKRAAGL